ncbi:MAG: hypothetical protein H0W76_19705 [Pyrinomonadaceae bacterium]|nr:hypothetical protein [Pyrinomonadaceae bacterium]
MNQDEARNAAHELIEEAVAVATKAGIDPTSIIETYLPQTLTTPDAGGQQESPELMWHGVSVTIDAAIAGLFEMPELNDDPDQQPAFHVTQSTADFVQQDFERYGAALERMAESWREEKTLSLSEKKGSNE